jgi:tetratricopeptide (TPR) repeat protein
MYATQPLRMEMELVKCMVLFILAAIVAMFLLNTAGGEVLPREPRFLPQDMAETAQPMHVAPSGLPMMDPTIDPNLRLWEIVEMHAAGEAEAALEAWETVVLPLESEVWRQLSMAVANLQLGQTDAAAEYLANAEAMQPENPLVHYYTAILRLNQAQHAQEWYDAIGGDIVRFAAYRPTQVVPNTRGMYQLHAMMEFEEAIALTKNVDLTMPLVRPDEYYTAVVVPPVTVGNLLTALGAEKFAGQAHNMLGAMCLEREAVDLAEVHMDAAAAEGVSVVFGYRELGAAYEGQGRYNDAARAYLKSIGHEGGTIRPLYKFLENVGNAVLQ